MSTTAKIHNIEELRAEVGKELDDLRGELVRNVINIHIYVYDTLMDLSYKVENMLYCYNGEYCHSDRALLNAYDLARDIERVAVLAKRHDLAAIGEKVAHMIRNYEYDYEDVEGSDE